MYYNTNMPNNQSILAKSTEQLHADCDEMEILLVDLHQKLQILEKRVQKVQKLFPEGGAGTFRNHFQQVQTDIKALQDNLKAFEKKLHDTRLTQADPAGIIREKNTLWQGMRTNFKVIGSLVALLDWQSPVYAFSQQSLAGIQTGSIYESSNDYKRDQHADCMAYEQVFLKEYIDHVLPIYIHAYATNSGMAAYSVIIAYLSAEKHMTDGVVFIGKNVYFEVRDHLRKLMGAQCIEVDETNIGYIVDQVKKVQPVAMFFDTVGNTPDNTLLDADALQADLARIGYKGVLVLDNTCASVSYQPFRDRKPWHSYQLVVWESLNKFHQFGMDAVMGGIVLSHGGDGVKLFDYRGHMGAMLSDAAVSSLPSPNRRLLEKRLDRLSENTKYISGELQNHIMSHNTKIERVVSPLLDDHRSHAIQNEKEFTMAFCMLRARTKHQTKQTYRDIVKRVMHEAKKQKVDLYAGTSFGFNWTRVYPTAMRSKSTVPFLRISPGTQTQWELAKILACIQSAI